MSFQPNIKPNNCVNIPIPSPNLLNLLNIGFPNIQCLDNNNNTSNSSNITIRSPQSTINTPNSIINTPNNSFSSNNSSSNSIGNTSNHSSNSSINSDNNGHNIPSQLCDNVSLLSQNLNICHNCLSINGNINYDYLKALVLQCKNYELCELENRLLKYNNNKLLKDCDYWKNKCLKMQKKKLNQQQKKQDNNKITNKFGFSNFNMRKNNGDFEYSADQRFYNVPRQHVTKIRWETETYFLGVHKVGYKEVQFTNSCNIIFNINDLSIYDCKNNKFMKIIKIKNLGPSFGCIYDDNNNNSNDSYYCNSKCSQHNNTRRVRSFKSYCHHGDNVDDDSGNIISPDDHFLICFEHPITSKVGTYPLSYRLYSQKKADNKRFKGNGCFGQKINFCYRIIRSQN